MANSPKHLLIRKAKQGDSKRIASLLSLAMLDIIYGFIGEGNTEKALVFMSSLVSETGNQYSFENCWVLEVNNEVIAAACVYDGAKLQELRIPVISKIKEMFHRDFVPEDETQPGEYYIDSIGVDPKFQGQGLGTSIFEFLIGHYVISNNQTLGLLVEKEKTMAKKLYQKLGFKFVGEKTLVGKPMEHMQFSPQYFNPGRV